MPEWAVGIAGLSQHVEQDLGSALQVILQVGVAARRHFVDREVVRVGAASADELERRHQIAPDPPLQALKRDPRNAPGALVIRRIVDDERLDRRKEHSRNLAHKGGTRRRSRDGAAQFLQDEFVAGRFFVGQAAAFEFGSLDGPRLRRQRPQIIRVARSSSEPPPASGKLPTFRRWASK